jgi:hypothetical protein
MTQEFPAPEGPVEVFPNPTSVPPRKSNATTWIIVAVVIVLLCCCCLVVAGYFLWQNGDQWFDLTHLLAPYYSLI